MMDGRRIWNHSSIIHIREIHTHFTPNANCCICVYTRPRAAPHHLHKLGQVELSSRALGFRGSSAAYRRNINRKWLFQGNDINLVAVITHIVERTRVKQNKSIFRGARGSTWVAPISPAGLHISSCYCHCAFNLGQRTILSLHLHSEYHQHALKTLIHYDQDSAIRQPSSPHSWLRCHGHQLWLGQQPHPGAGRASASEGHRAGLHVLGYCCMSQTRTGIGLGGD